MKDRIEGRPHGITYVTLGGLREDLLSIAEFIDGMRGGIVEMGDEEFRAHVFTRLEEIGGQVDELYDGMNFLWDVLSTNGLTPTREVEQEEEEVK